jgi:hypothetical protein
MRHPVASLIAQTPHDDAWCILVTLVPAHSSSNSSSIDPPNGCFPDLYRHLIVYGHLELCATFRALSVLIQPPLQLCEVLRSVTSLIEGCSMQVWD